MMQTLAIFRGTYRNLKARKMFWIVLILTMLLVVAMACVGIDESGVSLLFWTVTSIWTTENVSRPVFYNFLFSAIGIDTWLSWIASILALISTAGIFPDLVAGGSIDLVLSKPISRARLFLTQYAAGLLFVTLQVGLFTGASFLVIGLRGGSWQPELFLAVPLVVCFFSYLFAVCAFLGVATRSALAALLLTLLFWFLLHGLHSADVTVGLFSATSQQQADVIDGEIRGLRRQVAKRSAQSRPAGDPAAAAPDDKLASLQRRIAESQKRRAEKISQAESLNRARGVLVGVKTFLPKTAETVELLQRFLIRVSDLPGIDQAGPQKRLVAELRERSVTWIIGTSLIFEAVILALGMWVFQRRDF